MSDRVSEAVNVDSDYRRDHDYMRAGLHPCRRDIGGRARMTYTFDFDRLTIGDLWQLLQSARDNDTTKVLELVARASVTDAYALPMTELSPLLQQFGVALNAHLAAAQATSDTPDAMRLLRSIFGSEPQ
jgi:hypothetical protein